MSNGPWDELSGRELGAAEARWSGELERAADHPHVAAWRAAFSGFRAKPSCYAVSVKHASTAVLRAT